MLPCMSELECGTSLISVEKWTSAEHLNTMLKKPKYQILRFFFLKNRLVPKQHCCCLTLQSMARPMGLIWMAMDYGVKHWVLLLNLMAQIQPPPISHHLLQLHGALITLVALGSLLHAFLLLPPHNTSLRGVWRLKSGMSFNSFFCESFPGLKGWPKVGAKDLNGPALIILAAIFRPLSLNFQKHFKS